MGVICGKFDSKKKYSAPATKFSTNNKTPSQKKDVTNPVSVLGSSTQKAREKEENDANNGNTYELPPSAKLNIYQTYNTSQSDEGAFFESKLDKGFLEKDTILMGNKPSNYSKRDDRSRSNPSTTHISEVNLQEKSKTLAKKEEEYILNKSNYKIERKEGRARKDAGPYFIFFDEEEIEPDDFYYELKAKDREKYQEILTTLKEQTINRTGLGVASTYSTFGEWSKFIQKCSISSEKGIDNHSRNKNIIMDVYRSLINLKERNWYEEVTQLYKEKNSSKTAQNVSSMNFDRKYIQIYEHFRWFVSAVANVCFNFNSFIGSKEFPPQKSGVEEHLHKRSSSKDSTSYQKRSESDNQLDNLDTTTPAKNSTYAATTKQSLRSKSSNPGVSETSKATIVHNTTLTQEVFPEDLPNYSANIWYKGFIWKGVFFKLYSKKEARKFKCEIKALKNIAIDYLQTETTFKYQENSAGNINPLNDSLYHDLHNKSTISSNIIVNYILPLITYVESSSWIIVGTPFINNKRTTVEDFLLRIREMMFPFKSSIFLSNLTSKNLKSYNRVSEDITQQCLNSTQYTFAQNTTTLNFFLTNSLSLMPTHATAYVMFIINHDLSTNIVYREPPPEGHLSIETLKKIMGYGSLEIDSSRLVGRRDNKHGQLTVKSSYLLDVILFKKMYWAFQMVHMISADKGLLPFNKRATDLVQKSQQKYKTIEIFGNVLVFASYNNNLSLLHQGLFCDQETLNYFYLNSLLKQKRNKLKKEFLSSKSGDKVVPDTIRLVRKQEIMHQESEHDLQEYLMNSYSVSIKKIVLTLETSDLVINPAALKDLFNRHSLNIRYAWIVYSKLKNLKAKALLGSDILGRVIKNILNYETSKTLKAIKKKFGKGYKPSKEKPNEETNEKHEFFSETLYKTKLIMYLSLLMKSSENTKENDEILSKLLMNLNLNRMRVFHHVSFLASDNEREFLQSSQILKDLITLPMIEANSFLNAIQHHTNVSLSYEIFRKIRNDKYYYLLNKSSPFRLSDVRSVYHKTISYLTLRERAWLSLIKQSALAENNTENFSYEITFPSTLYKIKKRQNEILQGLNTGLVVEADCCLSDRYFLPLSDVLNDWVVYLEVVLNSLQTVDGDQNCLLEAYILQIIETYFIDQDEEQCRLICEKTFNLYTPLSSPEIVIIIHTWSGILAETKSMQESEQHYMMALLAIHKLYGDPRGRGSTGVTWELFLTWRLSIIARLQLKSHDSEYVEELFDATILSLKTHEWNSFLSKHYIYNRPFRPYEWDFDGEKENKFRFQKVEEKIPKKDQEPLDDSTNDFGLKDKKVRKTSSFHNNMNSPSAKKIDEPVVIHPFSHWTSYLKIVESSSKNEVLTSTLQKNEEFFQWMLQNLPTFYSTGVIWYSSSLKNFYMNVMQNAFTSNSTLSSISNSNTSNIVQEKRDDAKIRGASSEALLRKQKKAKSPKQPGNLVQIFEKDSSTFSKKETLGVAFIWGQNADGQLGSIITGIDENNSSKKLNKKLKLYHPKLLLPLKDSIIISVTCGHAFTFAITINRHLIAWGLNKSHQLGLGEDAPQNVLIPTQVSGIENVYEISCGREHSVALDGSGSVYSWGQGEGGLLGHGDTKTLSVPKIIEALRGAAIEHISCGGQHTLALSKHGHVYSWGRGEGGQLGLPTNILNGKPNNSELYLMTPKRIRSALEGCLVKQIAGGDAHSLALTQGGLVYGWGYTDSGQLGLGIVGDDPQSKQVGGVQIGEPQLIQKLSNHKISSVYAGSTFSIFMTEKKDLLSCGTNDNNQLGLDKNPIKLSTINVIDNYRAQPTSKQSDIGIPKKMECFHEIPILEVSCGENHSLAFAIVENKSYMVFSWGMNKFAQLGLGDLGQNSSNPRPITYLQDIAIYSMSCGSSHSVVVVGDTSNSTGVHSHLQRTIENFDSSWNFVYFNDIKDLAHMIEKASKKVVKKEDMDPTELETYQKLS